MKYYYDLHIHSALSPCGDNDMTPSNIVNMAYLKELSMIAVCDHNSCLNIEPVIHAAENLPLTVIPAMELETAEEVHCLCYFRDLETALKFGVYVSENTSKIQLNDKNKKIYGEQIIFGENDEIKGNVDHLLITASDISIETAEKEVHKLNGIFIPAHFDKSANSVSANLGFLPPSLKIDGVEWFSYPPNEKFLKMNRGIEKLPYLKNSDAHYLHQISEKENFLDLEDNTVDAFFKFIQAI